MGDLTPLFKKCVQIIDDEIARDPNFKRPVAKDLDSDQLERFRLKDTFVKECYDLLNFLMELRRVLTTIEPEYANDNNLNMTESEKDDFDTEFRLQYQQYIQKFKQLEKYETDREQLIETQLTSAEHSLKNLLLGSRSERTDTLRAFHTMNNRYRMGILQSLNLELGSVSSQFTAMQQERLESQRKFEFFDPNSGGVRTLTPIQTKFDESSSVNGNGSGDELGDKIEEPLSITVQSPVETVQEEVKHYEETMSKLTQEQLQVLETEHEELLNQKNEQLQHVEKINKTILDIVSIQSELSTHLQAQSQNINTILDNQADIQVNIEKGNKQLKNAQQRASRTAQMTKFLAILFGILILLLDYISW